MKNIKEIKHLAEEKANSQHEKGCSEWYANYYGFIYGFQDSQKETDKLLKEQIEGIRQWLIDEDYEGLAERL